MVATRIVYSKWKSFVQGVETVFFVLFGFFAVFFTAPKSWNQGNTFSQNTAHAETPAVTPDPYNPYWWLNFSSDPNGGGDGGGGGGSGDGDGGGDGGGGGGGGG